MADNLTDHEENRLLNLSLPAGGGVYLALFTAAPDETGGGTEPAGDGYARQELATTAAAAGSKANAADVLFGAATAGWGTILAVGVYDALTAGNLRWYRTLTAGEQRTVNLGDQYRVAAGALTFSIA